MPQANYDNLALLAPEDRYIDYTIPFSKTPEPILDHLYNVCNILVYCNHIKNDHVDRTLVTLDTVPEGFEALSVSGGITNRLFVCRYKTEQYPPILVRLFARHSADVINRDSELRVAQLMSRTLVGPTICGLFNTGRLEGFIEDPTAPPGGTRGAPSLTPELFLDPNISIAIAEQLGKLHSSSLSGQDARNTNIDALHGFDYTYPNQQDQAHKPTSLPEATLWSTITTWFQSALTKRHIFQGISSSSLDTYDNLCLDRLFRETIELKTLLDFLDDPVVFCHNDLLSGNILRLPSNFNWNEYRHQYGGAPKQKNSQRHSSIQTLRQQSLSKHNSGSLSSSMSPMSSSSSVLPLSSSEPHQQPIHSIASSPVLSPMTSDSSSMSATTTTAVALPCHDIPINNNPTSATTTIREDTTTIHEDTITKDTITATTNADNDDDLPSSVLFIDFEYGSMNYASFDIANHMCESCGFNCDWRQFPNEEHQIRFITTYLRVNNGIDINDPYLQSSIFKGQVEIIRRRVIGFVLAAHIFWGIWAVIMASNKADIDFDYLSYAKLRFEGYWYMKNSALLTIIPLIFSKIHEFEWKRQLHQIFTHTTDSIIKNHMNGGVCIVGWGMAGKYFHTGTIGAARGVYLQSAVIRQRDDETDDEWITRSNDAKYIMKCINNYYNNEVGIHINCQHLHLPASLDYDDSHITINSNTNEIICDCSLHISSSSSKDNSHSCSQHQQQQTTESGLCICADTRKHTSYHPEYTGTLALSSTTDNTTLSQQHQQQQQVVQEQENVINMGQILCKHTQHELRIYFKRVLQHGIDSSGQLLIPISFGYNYTDFYTQLGPRHATSHTHNNTTRQQQLPSSSSLSPHAITTTIPAPVDQLTSSPLPDTATFDNSTAIITPPVNEVKAAPLPQTATSTASPQQQGSQSQQQQSHIISPSSGVANVEGMLRTFSSTNVDSLSTQNKLYLAREAYVGYEFHENASAVVPSRGTATTIHSHDRDQTDGGIVVATTTTQHPLDTIPCPSYTTHYSNDIDYDNDNDYDDLYPLPPPALSMTLSNSSQGGHSTYTTAPQDILDAPLNIVFSPTATMNRDILRKQHLSISRHPRYIKLLRRLQLSTESQYQPHFNETEPTVYKTINDACLYDSNIAITVIATPPSSHSIYAIDAIKSRKHVIVDKPFTPNVQQTIYLISLAKQYGVGLSCFQNRRFDADFITAQHLLHHRKTLGDNVKWIETAYQKGISLKQWKLSSHEDGGGRLFDLGAHTIDQLIQLSQSTPKTVYANILYEIEGYPSIDSHAQLTITFENGLVGIVDLNSMTMVEKPRYYIVGDVATYIQHGMDAQENTLLSYAPINTATEDSSSYGKIVFRPYQILPSYYKDRFDKQHNERVNKGEHPIYPKEKLVPLYPARWPRYYEKFQQYITQLELLDSCQQYTSNVVRINNISSDYSCDLLYIPYPPTLISNEIYNMTINNPTDVTTLKEIASPVDLHDTLVVSCLYEAILRSSKTKHTENVILPYHHTPNTTTTTTDNNNTK